MFDSTLLAEPGAQIVSILVGIIILILGRKLFWFFVGVMGFVLGLALTLQFLTEPPGWVVLIVALLVGIVGAIVAIFVQKIAVALAGFVAGGYVIIWLLRLFELNLGQWEWLIFIAGGLIGAILVLVLFEVALIVLSSLLGATLIVQATDFSPVVSGLLFLVLLIVGLVVQSRTLNNEAAAEPEQPSS